MAISVDMTLARVMIKSRHTNLRVIMSIGKYSPTVSQAYQKSQNWWEQNGGNQENLFYDKEGFDSYGYNSKGVDRAGYTEEDYMFGYIMTEENEPYYHLFKEVLSNWQIDESGKPKNTTPKRVSAKM